MSCYETGGAAIVKKVIKLFFLGSCTQLGGATWFLRTLLMVSIGNMFVRYLVRRTKRGEMIFITLAVICAVCAQFISSYNISIPLGIQTCFAAYVAFIMGIFIKRSNIMEFITKHWIAGVTGSFIILAALDHCGSISMARSQITNIAFFIIASLSGWILIYMVSEKIANTKMGAMLNYIGKHTMSIMMLHFLSFKFVSLIHIKIRGMDYLYLARFPAIKDNTLIWIPYTVIGIVLPIIVEYIVKTYSGKVMSFFKGLSRQIERW